MKNAKIIYLVAGLMALSAPQLTRGDDATPAERPNREELREKFQNLSPEERAAKLKEFREKHPDASANFEKRRDDAMKQLGLKPEELKKLPESERREKIKEAADKKLAELQKKKADGTISDSEKQMLTNLERRQKLMKEHPGGFGGRGQGKRGVKKPSDK